MNTTILYQTKAKILSKKKGCYNEIGKNYIIKMVWYKIIDKIYIIKMVWYKIIDIIIATLNYDIIFPNILYQSK